MKTNYLTVEETIARTKLGRGTIEKFIRDNRYVCKKVKVGKHWKWMLPETSVDKLAESYAIPDGWIATNDAAQIASVKESTIHTWCGNGYVVARKLPSTKWIIKVDSLNNFLERRAASSRSAADWASDGADMGLHIKEAKPQKAVVAPIAVDDIDEKAPQAWRTNYRRGKRSGVYCADIEGKRVGNAKAVNDFEKVHE